MAKKPNKSRNMNVYSNLTRKRRTRKDAEARKKAEYLASLPKHPVKRFLHRVQPRNFFGYWFSKRGGIMALKVTGVGILMMVLSVGALFAYYRKDLDSIRPGEINKRVQTTVTRYVDRNGVLLWEDKGNGNYKLVVDSEDISPYLKEATIAIEDQDFYDHGGISVSGIMRSLINNAQGGSVQGGSTLTQQLVKQVFFAEQAHKRGIGGIPRKIKEMILSVEVERMYDKESILALYLNESPYGGRRNGAESAAQTYFGIPAKDLTLPQAALLAAIPNQPGLYDPYNIAGHEALISRQHKVLNSMAAQDYITKTEAEEAKEYPILDSILPASNPYKNIKAPHFVQMVRAQLERELGKATVGRGGLTVKTTLDIRIQERLKQSMDDMFNSSVPDFAGFTNGAATVEDTKTGQIVAMMGSRDFNYPGFGQDNAAMAYIQPGSTIKPLVYAELFSNQGKGKANYGSGSILADDSSMDEIYGAELKNADGRYMGAIDIRKSLALSRNIPAVKAMHIAGIKPTLETIRALGDINYCTQGADAQAGLSAAIGGCGTRQVEHVNAFASLARMGVYKPVSTILEVKNSQGEVIKKYKDESKQVIDPQVAYILADILSDDSARAGLYGSQFYGLYIPGVKTAAKTGTSDKGGKPKDIWTMSYSPALTMGVWFGNPDTRVLTNGNSSLPAKIIGEVMEYAHKEVYAAEDKWSPENGGNWYDRPEGIQVINGELYPSWYSKNQGQTNAKLVFDKVSKKKATDCTPDGARIEIFVVKFTDPITKRVGYITTEGYDATEDDDVHNCDDSKPSVGTISASNDGDIEVSVAQGEHAIREVEIRVGGTIIATLPGSGNTYRTNYSPNGDETQTITVTVTDSVYYTATKSQSATFKADNSGNNDDDDD
ncbi:MAG TPA: transglycosylase domain-containing protein [Candidatus Saccharimonadales bacterium]|nr:transglycosylase domain-containing protein [Candidatus Saccharimonadales bacterium]